MKASNIEPTGWLFGVNKGKTAMLMRKWDGIRRNVRNMENIMLELLSNPATTPDQLAMASKLYKNVTKQLDEHARVVDEFIYHGIKPKPVVRTCTFCGSSSEPIEEGGSYPFCPDCKAT
jgi:hypothetical protein